jgi:L-lactate dehydrogenase (cytochrome)
MIGRKILADVADYRAAARRRLPRFLFDYIDGGAFSESTLRRNVEDLQAISLRQSVLRDVSALSLETTLFGQALAMPVALAPIGLAGMNARRGEVQAARAAHKAGVPFILSTVSLCSCEEVAQGAPYPFWFQFYFIRDRGFMRAMLARAKAAGATALVLTVDMCAPGTRYRDIRSGLSGGGPVQRKLMRLAQALARPGWALDVGVRGRPHTLGHIASVLGERAGLDEFWAWLGERFDPSVTWRDLDEIRAAWEGPLIVKGVLTPEDARAAVAAGADGVVVSNHGGRQLDGARSAIRALPPIADAVGGRATVLMDGGIRSGADVVRALALGARGVLIGRAWAYGLAAKGERGVLDVLSILDREMRIALALTGCAGVAEIGPHLLDRDQTDLRSE